MNLGVALFAAAPQQQPQQQENKRVIKIVAGMVVALSAIYGLVESPGLIVPAGWAFVAGVSGAVSGCVPENSYLSRFFTTIAVASGVTSLATFGWAIDAGTEDAMDVPINATSLNVSLGR